MTIHNLGLSDRLQSPKKCGRTLRLVLWLLCISWLLPQLHAQDIPLWTRALFVHPTGGFGPETRFSLRRITQEGLHLTGQCTYYQVQNQTPPVASIQGTKTAGGIFWPEVTSQVKDERTGKWETIAEPFYKGRRTTIAVTPGELNQDLMISLDYFVPFIGKHKLGRVLLRTGEAAMFELRYLLEDEP